MDSPAVERVEISRHRVVRPELSPGTAGPDAIESRIVALEQQQSFDHKYLEQIATAVRSLYEAQEWERLRRNEVDEQSITLDMNMRRDLAATREELQSLYNKVPGMATQELEHFFGFGRGCEIIKRADVLDEKILTIQKVLDEMQGKGARAESYLTQLHSERPKEGQAVVELVQKEVSQVREMVNRFEPPHSDPKLVTHAHGVPFTQDMMNSLAEMEKKVLNHEVVQAHFNETLMQHAGYEQRIVAVESQILKVINYAEQDKAEAPRTTSFSMCGAYGAARCSGHGAPGTGTGTGTTGGAETTGTGTGSGAWSSWQTPTPPGMPQDGTAPPGGGGVPLPVLHALIGGNGQCHCVHVSELQAKVAGLEARGAGSSKTDGGSGTGRGEDPLFRTGWSKPPATTGEPTAPTTKNLSLPLDLEGPLGAIAFKDKHPIFDEKLAVLDAYGFNGTKGGLAWKGKVERHFISRAPVLKEILEWAEARELHEIDGATFKKAVSRKLDDEQALVLNAALWGFLSAAVSGTAETVFKGAKTLNGIDAWRRLARFIDHGKGIRLETLRREIKMLHTKPIPSLEKVEEGVAEWEDVYQEYCLAGGSMLQDPEMKADLLAVLPGELRETLLWKTTEEDVSYQQFRDHVLTQAGRVLMNRKKLPIHAVDDGSGDDDDENDLTDILTAIQKFQHGGCDADLVAAVQRFQRGRGGRFQRRNPGRTSPPPPRPAEDRPPRKCPNCGKTHAGRCTAAPVSPDERPCWTCGKKGHVSRNCPDKKREGSAVKAVDDRRSDHVQACFSVTDEGDFKTVASRRRAAPTGRPMPTTPTLGDYLDKNKFAVLSTADPSGSGLAETDGGRARLGSSGLAETDGGRARLGSSGLAETDGGRARLGPPGPPRGPTQGTTEGAARSAARRLVWPRPCEALIHRLCPRSRCQRPSHR